MLRTIEATIDKRGKVKLSEPISLKGEQRALVTILDENWAEDAIPNETALLAETALAKDWLSKEEDEAWKHLADLPDLDEQKKNARRK